MARIAPPRPPIVGLADDDHLRLRFRQIGLTAATIVATAWLCTLGWIPAILALVTAKHVLVAILVMGLGVDARTEPELTAPADLE
jgi:hypothetical protein